MSRLTTNFEPTPEAAQALENIKKSIGMVPNIHKLMAYSPKVLEGYLAFSGALAKGSLSAQDREHIALTLAGYNRCEYCASAHSLIGSKAGIPADEAMKNLQGKSADPKVQTLVDFCLTMASHHGNVSDEQIQSLKAAGFTDEQLVEIIAAVSLNIFTNYFNHVLKTDIDFPKVSLPVE